MSRFVSCPVLCFSHVSRLTRHRKRMSPCPYNSSSSYRVPSKKKEIHHEALWLVLLIEIRLPVAHAPKLIVRWLAATSYSLKDALVDRKHTVSYVSQFTAMELTTLKPWLVSLCAHITLWLKVSQGAHSLHPHAIHDVTCLSVRCLF